MCLAQQEQNNADCCDRQAPCVGICMNGLTRTLATIFTLTEGLSVACKRHLPGSFRASEDASILRSVAWHRYKHDCP